ncbi:threonine/serine exporter family protein [Brevibacillus daliensis]|uniref:threonine/serine exporter family protein n=1 Tax=Brevibacillus daliensis TaxID=2892995 RepID=UPI001E32AA2D|nr:threonine/serine exporter family protein [Brevibacillus daliensis]
MLKGMLLSYIITFVYAMLFNAPKHTIFYAGAVGMSGWIIYKMLPAYGAELTLASFAAGTFISLTSQILSIKMKVPSTNFSIAGIIPLVPGSTAYKSMLAFINTDYVGGITLGVMTMMYAGAIAAGLILGVSIFSLWKGIVARHVRKGAKAN